MKGLAIFILAAAVSFSFGCKKKESAQQVESIRGFSFPKIFHDRRLCR